MVEMNVLKPCYAPWKYASNWKKNIRMFFKSLKMAWQRITKGYCEWDIYDLNEYYTELIGDSAREFLAQWKDRYDETATFDKLYDLVDAFDGANKAIGTATDAMKAFAEIMKRHTVNDDDDEAVDDYTPEERAVIEHVHEEWAEQEKERLHQLHKGLTLLNEIIEELWI